MKRLLALLLFLGCLATKAQVLTLDLTNVTINPGVTLKASSDFVLGGGPWRDVRAYGAVLDGSTDDSAAVQAAIQAGTGRVLIPTNACAIASSISLTNDVILLIPPGASLKWTGAAGGTMITSSASITLVRSGIVGGGRIDLNSLADYAIDLHSAQQCVIENLDFPNGTATSTILRLVADSSVGGGFVANAYSAFNSIKHLSAGTCGNFLVLSGATNGVTLNYFESLTASDVRLRGIDIVKRVDNNYFGGFNRFSLTADNAIGLDVNSNDVGVYATYANNFATLAVDTFGVIKTNRIGIRLKESKLTFIDSYHNDPAAEGGSIVNLGSLSHLIKGYAVATNAPASALASYQKGNVWINSDPIITLSDSSSITPSFIATNTATSGQSQMIVAGKTSGGTVIVGSMLTAVGGSVLIGSSSAHVTRFQSGGVETFRLQNDGSSMIFAEGKDVDTGTTTGTKLGRLATHKIGFHGATPIVQPSATAELKGAVLVAYGFVPDGSATPLDLDGGTLTAGSGIFSKALIMPSVAVTDAATITTDASAGNYFRVTLAGNRTLANPTNPSDGQRIVWELIQDGTGTRTLAYDTKFAFGTDIPSATLTVTASKRDFLTVLYNSTADKFYVVAFVKGF